MSCKERECVICGKVFTMPSNFANKLCCSPECSIINRNNKTKARYEAKKHKPTKTDWKTVAYPTLSYGQLVAKGLL